LVFYYGHPAVFYINKLRVAGLLDRGLNPYFEVVFETGVDEMSWDDLSKNAMDWPSVESIHAYRKMVYATVSEVISNISDETCATITPESPLWCLPMAMEHERIHIETSSVLMNELPLEYVRAPEEIFPAYHPSAGKLTASQPQVDVDYPQNAMISVPHTQVNLGKPAAAATYGWDNEYGQRSYDVPAFSASQFKVSNGEFAEFVRDGGYSKREHWTERGWEWRAYRNAKWPTFWLPKGPQGLHQYDLRLLFDVVPMPWSWPVAVNLHEANAFAMWRGAKEGKAMRVMTELEYTAMRDTGGPTDAGVDAVVDQPAGTRLSDSGINGNLSFASMSPVDAMPPNAGGFYDVVGNAWEWNIDYFSALSGFKVHPFYEDFSSPCFDGLHNVIQGSSFISTGNLSSVYSRYHFRPHFFQHASFRVVHSASETVTSDVDAPGPYVGHYPYRQSREGLKVASQREYAKKNSHDKQLSRHFGPALEAFGVPLPTFTERLTDAVVSTANQQGINLAEAKVLGKY
jgi:5-histidylcysteine sulfoxide synthase